MNIPGRIPWRIGMRHPFDGTVFGHLAQPSRDHAQPSVRPKQSAVAFQCKEVNNEIQPIHQWLIGRHSIKFNNHLTNSQNIDSQHWRHEKHPQQSTPRNRRQMFSFSNHPVTRARSINLARHLTRRPFAPGAGPPGSAAATAIDEIGEKVSRHPAARRVLMAVETATLSRQAAGRRLVGRERGAPGPGSLAREFDFLRPCEARQRRRGRSTEVSGVLRGAKSIKCSSITQSSAAFALLH